MGRRRVLHFAKGPTKFGCYLSACGLVRGRKTVAEFGVMDWIRVTCATCLRSLAVDLRRASRATHAPEEMSPLVNFMTACLTRAAEEAPDAA